MDFSRLRASTIPGLLVERARARPARVAFRAKELGVYRETTWAALAARVAAVAQGLAARFGVGRGSTVAILGDPCPEWTIADLAAQALGAVTYGIYPTSAPGEVRYLLEHGGARVVIVEDQEHLDKTLAVLDDAPGVRGVIVVDTRALFMYRSTRVHRFADIVRHYPGSVATVAESLYEVAPTFVFTVPRYLQKFAAHLLVGIDASTTLKRAAYHAALRLGARAVSRGATALPARDERGGVWGAISGPPMRVVGAGLGRGAVGGGG